VEGMKINTDEISLLEATEFDLTKDRTFLANWPIQNPPHTKPVTINIKHIDFVDNVIYEKEVFTYTYQCDPGVMTFKTLVVDNSAINKIATYTFTFQVKNQINVDGII
jgi:hypothetical protein